MSNEQLIMTLAKVLIAAAWADGEPSREEINSMKDLLFHLPQLSARQWASLQMYVDAPVDDAERARLVEDLRYAIRSPSDQALALDTLDELIHADGEETQDERQAVAEIKAAVQSVDVGVFARLVKGMTGRRTRAVANAPNREDYFEDYVKNKVYYGVRRRLDQGETDLQLSDDVLRTLSLAGGIMAQVARVNPNLAESEIDAMIDALQTHWHLEPDQAAFVADVAVSETASLMDSYRLAWQFSDVCTYQARVEFLDVLFAIAAADGEASYEEIEEIRTISQSLKLTHEDFITAKLKIPRDQRRQ
ncbi:MAG TPA: TerB family tellurite resistance protein [Anaerolineae bacterium]|nr:TerB family tellurite resistance protein [Anaerolineae bacterium]